MCQSRTKALPSTHICTGWLTSACFAGHVLRYSLWFGVSGSLLGPVLGNLDELLEEVGGQGVFLAWPLRAMQLAVILDIHALARVRMVLIILLVIIQFHIHPEKEMETY